MDLAKQAKIVDGIHDTLNDFVGQRLKVRANMGRSKIVESEGVLTQVHPQLFIMEVDRKRGRTARQSYQYVDVLTGMVELSQNGEPLYNSLPCGALHQLYNPCGFCLIPRLRTSYSGEHPDSWQEVVWYLSAGNNRHSQMKDCYNVSRCVDQDLHLR